MEYRKHLWASLHHAHFSSALLRRQQEVETGKEAESHWSQGPDVSSSIQTRVWRKAQGGQKKAQGSQSKENASTPRKPGAFDRRKKGSTCRICRIQEFEFAQNPFCVSSLRLQRSQYMEKLQLMSGTEVSDFCCHRASSLTPSLHISPQNSPTVSISSFPVTHLPSSAV